MDVNNQSVTLVDYTNRASIPGVTSNSLFNSFYAGPVIFNSSSSMLRSITTHRSFSDFTKRLNEPRNSSLLLTTRSWYPICLRSVFQPSDFLMSFLNPFLTLFKDHFMIGMHIRMAGSLSVWKDDARLRSGFKSDFDFLTTFFRNIRMLIFFLVRILGRSREI